MRKILLFIILNVSIQASSCYAEAYVGASIGDSNVSLDNYNKPVGYKFFIGADINDRFGLELGLINLGDFTIGSLSTKISGTELSAVGFIPVGSDGKLFGKIGLFNWNIDSNSISSNGTDFTLGLGIQFPVKDNILFRLEYQEFRDIRNSSDDFTFLSIGLAVKF